MNNGNRFFKYAGILNIKRYALFQRAETPGAKNINVLYHILNTHFGELDQWSKTGTALLHIYYKK
jgi:hypothetical protein